MRNVVGCFLVIAVLQEDVVVLKGDGDGALREAAGLPEGHVNVFAELAGTLPGVNATF